MSTFKGVLWPDNETPPGLFNTDNNGLNNLSRPFNQQKPNKNPVKNDSQVLTYKRENIYVL